MSIALSEKSVLVLAANGFDENHMTAMQRALTKVKAPYKIVAPEQGLVNGWQDNAWGHYFTVDCVIGTVLGSDFDALVLIGGERGVAKLKDNPHTRRIVNHFLEAGKPVSGIGAGISLLALSPKSAGLTVAAPESLEADLKAAQIERSPESQTLDGVVLSADGTAIDVWVDASLALFAEVSPFREDEQVAA
jgi:protease I